MSWIRLAGPGLLLVALVVALLACDTSSDYVYVEESWLSQQTQDWPSVAVTPAPQGTPTSLHSEPTSVSIGGYGSGYGNVCVLRADGSLYCGSHRLTSPDGLFTSVSVGGRHACGVRTDGTVVCWGEHEYGQATPPPAGGFTSISVGGRHACGVRTDGTVVCWGEDEYGQATPPAGGFTSISVGDRHACGVRSDGAVDCWGDDEYGQATPPDWEFALVSAGSSNTCGVGVDGSIACWGQPDWFDPDTPPPAGAFTSVSVGGSVACGLRENKTLACWRFSKGFGLSDPDIPPRGTFTSMSMDGSTACAVSEDGSVTCWGRVYPFPFIPTLWITGRTSDSLTVELVEPKWWSDTETQVDSSYQIHVSQSPEGPYSLVMSDIDTGTHVVGDLQPSAVYYLVLLVCDEIGCSQVVAVATTESDGPMDAPSTPADFRGEKIDIAERPDNARLTWNAVDGATYYELWKGSDPDLPFELLIQISAPLEAQFFDISPNRTTFGEYSLTSWKVRACNKAGCSAFTNTVTVN